MTSSFSDDMNSILDNAKNELVEKLNSAIKEETKKLIDLNEIIKHIDVAHLVRQAAYDYFRQSVANEVANQLRCGIYQGTKIDLLFQSAWTSEFDKAIQERIRQRAFKAVDDVIAERLKKM